LLETQTLLQCRLIPDVPLLSPQRSAMTGGLRLIPGSGSVSLCWMAGRTGTRTEQERAAHIRNALPRLFPDWEAEEPHFRQEIHPLDGLPVIGQWRAGGKEIILAAGLGSMLADLLAGYASYALGTLVIKAGVACVAAFVFRRCGKGKFTRQTLVAMIAAGILAEAFMVLGYFTYESIILGMGMGAAGAIIGNIGQGAVGVIVACIVAPVLMRSREVAELMNRT